jgi:hypothetical protein
MDFVDLMRDVSVDRPQRVHPTYQVTPKDRVRNPARLLNMTPRQIAYRIQILKIKMRQI